MVPAFVDSQFAGIIITPRVIEIICKDGRQKLASIHWQNLQGVCLGSSRPLFVCPCCKGTRFKLYDVFGELYCKRCAAARGAVYACQVRSTKGRVLLQSQRLRRFLGEYPGCTTINRMSWMPRKTYKRLLSRLHQLEANSPRHAQTKAQSHAFHSYHAAPHKHVPNSHSVDCNGLSCVRARRESCRSPFTSSIMAFRMRFSDFWLLLAAGLLLVLVLAHMLFG